MLLSSFSLLVLRSSVFAVFELNQMDFPLSGSKILEKSQLAVVGQAEQGFAGESMIASSRDGDAKPPNETE